MEINEDLVSRLMSKALSGEVDGSTVAAVLEGRCRAVEKNWLFWHDFVLCHTRPDGTENRLVIPRRSDVGQAELCVALVLLDHGEITCCSPVMEDRVELSLTRGLMRIRDLGSARGVSVRREVVRSEILKQDDVLEFGGSKLEICEMVQLESAASERDSERGVLFVIDKPKATSRQLHELLGGILAGEISESVMEAVLMGYRAGPFLRDCTRLSRLAVRCQSPDGRSRFVELPPSCRLTVGRTTGDIRLDDPEIEDGHLELSRDGETLKVSVSAPSHGTFLVHRVRGEEGVTLDLSETLTIDGLVCWFEMQAAPHVHEESNEEKSVLFDLNAIAQADQSGQELGS